MNTLAGIYSRPIHVEILLPTYQTFHTDAFMAASAVTEGLKYDRNDWDFYEARVSARGYDLLTEACFQSLNMPYDQVGFYTLVAKKSMRSVSNLASFGRFPGTYETWVDFGKCNEQIDTTFLQPGTPMTCSSMIVRILMAVGMAHHSHPDLCTPQDVLAMLRPVTVKVDKEHIYRVTDGGITFDLDSADIHSYDVHV